MIRWVIFKLIFGVLAIGPHEVEKLMQSTGSKKVIALF